MKDLNGIQFSAKLRKSELTDRLLPTFEAHDPSIKGNNTMVGKLDLLPSGEVDFINVRRSHQRRGIATEMWNIANIAHQAMSSHYPKPLHAKERTPLGEAWAKSVDLRNERPEWDEIDPEDTSWMELK